MGTENIALWLFLAIATVATFSFISVIIWVGARTQERQQFYKFEFRKRLVEDGKMNAEAFAALMRYEHDLKLQQTRQSTITAAFVLLGVGVGLCVGFQFIPGDVWMIGIIPASIGLFLMIFGLFVADKPNLGQPPVGLAPSNELD